MSFEESYRHESVVLTLTTIDNTMIERRPTTYDLRPPQSLHRILIKVKDKLHIEVDNMDL